MSENNSDDLRIDLRYTLDAVFNADDIVLPGVKSWDDVELCYIDRNGFNYTLAAEPDEWLSVDISDNTREVFKFSPSNLYVCCAKTGKGLYEE